MMENVSPKRIEKGMYWDRAWSLVEGCSYVSEACENCWSAKQTAMREKQKNANIRSRYEGLVDEYGDWRGIVRFQWQDIIKPLSAKKPAVWAIWNDLFHERVAATSIFDTFHIIKNCPHHTFLILTKRPKRMLDLTSDLYGGKWPDNAIPGVTVELQKHVHRIKPLLQIPAKRHFVSAEPMLGPLRLCGAEVKSPPKNIDWVVCGCESGSKRRPTDIEWIRSLRDQCLLTETPFFLKQMEVAGKVAKMPELDGKIWNQTP